MKQGFKLYLQQSISKAIGMDKTFHLLHNKICLEDVTNYLQYQT